MATKSSQDSPLGVVPGTEGLIELERPSPWGHSQIPPFKPKGLRAFSGQYFSPIIENENSVVSEAFFTKV